jgi:hypothetical protein
MGLMEKGRGCPAMSADKTAKCGRNANVIVKQRLSRIKNSGITQV